jgi:single-strand DNA-binding protein
MSNEFRGTGNIGQAPTLRTVKVHGEDRSVVDLRVYFDRRIPMKDGSYDDDGGFWLTVSVWGSRADNAFKLFSKGMRIEVVGALRLETWENDNEVRTEFRLTADKVSIDPICLDSVILRKRTGTADEPDALPMDHQVPETA